MLFCLMQNSIRLKNSLIEFSGLQLKTKSPNSWRDKTSLVKIVETSSREATDMTHYAMDKTIHMKISNQDMLYTG